MCHLAGAGIFLTRIKLFVAALATVIIFAALPARAQDTLPEEIAAALEIPGQAWQSQAPSLWTIAPDGDATASCLRFESANGQDERLRPTFDQPGVVTLSYRVGGSDQPLIFIEGASRQRIDPAGSRDWVRVALQVEERLEIRIDSDQAFFLDNVQFEPAAFFIGATRGGNHPHARERRCDQCSRG